MLLLIAFCFLSGTCCLFFFAQNSPLLLAKTTSNIWSPKKPISPNDRFGLKCKLSQRRLVCPFFLQTNPREIIRCCKPYVYLSAATKAPQRNGREALMVAKSSFNLVTKTWRTCENTKKVLNLHGNITLITYLPLYI